jgi:hypothetical protein
MPLHVINGTKTIVDATIGLDPDGRERLVVIAKGTYRIPRGVGERAELAEEQRPLVTADTFSGEPGFSAPTAESDYAPHKPFCDVLVYGSAHAPSRPAARVRVTLRVGKVFKSFIVVGDRHYQRQLIGLGASAPRPFMVMPITYDRAFGGVDRNGTREETFRQNPAGVGYHPISSPSAIEGKPVPNTEPPGDPAPDPRGSASALGFGAVGRGWLPRAGFAGTYDQRWLDERFPFLPDDFDTRYHQAAPPDQQIPYPRGGEEIALENLTPGGVCSFRLPDLSLPVEVSSKGRPRVSAQAAPDTIVLTPDEGLLSITFRASFPLARDLLEVEEVIVGEMSKGFWRARARAKTYYPSLGALASAKRRGKAS